jgi:hypothetical protein
MAAVELEIVVPACDTSYCGEVTVELKGAIKELPAELQAATLYYRWYSNLFVGNPDEERFSINQAALTDPEQPYSTTLGIGSHVLTLAATDRPGESAADQEAVQHGGVCGGAKGDSRCVVHVFVANMLWSVPVPPVLSRNACTLEAEAPSQWGMPGNGDMVPNDTYHDEDVNRLQYRWRFEPIGPPAGRSPFELVPSLEQLTFVATEEDDEPVRVRYQGPLDSSMIGDYDLILFVEDRLGELGGDSVTESVEVVS